MRPLEVLIVEDDTILGCLIRDTVHNAGHTPTIANSVNAAKSHLASAACDVVLLDLNLDGESGEELIDRLQVAGIKIPAIVILSAQDEISIAQAAHRIGAVASIEKPCTVASIEAALAKLSV